MCATTTKIAAVLALAAAFAASVVAISLTVGKAADACALRSQTYAEKIGLLSEQNRSALTSLNRECLDWKLEASGPRSDWVSPF